jgi:uncharacterized protein (PEP-CTERM system associated)
LRGDRPGALLRIGLAAGLLASAAFVHGDGWEITPRLTARAILTDNAGLDPPGEEEGDLAWALNPAFSIHNREQGGRVKLDFDYTPIALAFSNSGADNDLIHRLQARANVEAVDDHLFVDVTGRAGQVNSVRTAAVSVDEIARQDDVEQSYAYGVSPYYVHHLGSLGDVELRYGFDQVLYDGDSAGNSSNRVDASFDSGSAFPFFAWGVSYRYQKIEYDDAGTEDPAQGFGRDQSFESVTGRVRYPFNRQWAVFGTLGYEDNTYETSGTEPKGEFWTVGVDWSPTDRTSFQVGYGDRYFGDHYFFDLQHRSRRTVWTASYREDVTTSRDILFERQLFALVDPFGNPIRDPLTGQDILIPIDIPTPTTDTIVQKRLQGSVTLQGRRTTTTLRVYHDERAFELGGEEDKVLGTSLQIQRTLSRDTTGSILALWQQRELGESTLNPTSGDGTEDEDFWSLRLSLTRRFNEDLSGTLEVGHQSNDSSVRDNDYRENRITAGLTYTF